MRQEILIGPERRRRWSDAQKIAIVSEAAEPGVSVADVARRHDITRQQIYQWRAAMRQGRLVDENGGPFLAVEYVCASAEAVVAQPPGLADCDALVEITLRKGRVMRIPATISPELLTALIRAAEAA
jgi:transposase